VALAKELGISRRLLYTWREKLEPTSSEGGPPANAREATLRKELSQLKRVLAEKGLEVDCFKRALHTIEARRQQTGTAGAQAATPTVLCQSLGSGLAISTFLRRGAEGEHDSEGFFLDLPC